jgi:CRISPR-associated protein Cmr2
MSAFWQAKIWGLLHDSPLKPLIADKSGTGPWADLEVMTGWQPPGKNDRLIQADYIAAATDRAAFGALGKWSEVDYGDDLCHLLSGENLRFQLSEGSPLRQKRNRITAEHTSIGKADWKDYTDAEKNSIRQLSKAEKEYVEKLIRNVIPKEIKQSNDLKEVFWWMWRCLPEALSRHPEINEPSLLLIPAETRIPDCSIWSHNSMVAALAGSLMGDDNTCTSRPYVATFTFTPVQDVVKASRKMQDFWAGSWILHYLSACICWAWANEYGPDAIVYPSLYDQPLIDHWLLNDKFPKSTHPHWHEEELIAQPTTRRLLTAGFPNVLVIVLPKNKVKSAMDLARRLLTGESQDIKSPWMTLADQVKREVFGNTPIAPSVWEEWLKSQWQIYWTALPLGDLNEPLAKPIEANFPNWRKKQNDLAGLSEKTSLFEDAEAYFFQKTERSKTREGNFHLVNIGSWWAPIFDQARKSLKAVKNARVWSLPTAFGSRSTISGVGSVVRRAAKNDWVYFDEFDDSNPVNQFWEKQRGLFDGKEQLNATEVVKRGLKRILERQVLKLSDEQKENRQKPAYPDLTVGVAGWLKHHPQEVLNYQDVCKRVLADFPWANDASQEPWGIPWIDDSERSGWQHPRLLNSSWLIDDYIPPTTDSLRPSTQKEKKQRTKEELSTLRRFLSKLFTSGNPTDWYVLAAGDGDDMGGWLKGIKMQPYHKYVPSNFPKQPPPTEEERSAFNNFLKQDKRMGPATHAALSRALLDFSNQLVPYLTEQRYAGRLIYGGGDDVLAYTNLWEWDSWLWDVRQCFRGDKDPHEQFDDKGDYWRWKEDKLPDNVSARPLFTMGGKASISFGIVIVHHSVPLAIALENLWEAEDEAKKYKFWGMNQQHEEGWIIKDAVQVRVIYGNGNVPKATAKFEVFGQWRSLLDCIPDLEPALFEQAAELWKQHPVPSIEAIPAWVQAFCSRREALSQDDDRENFGKVLHIWLEKMWQTNQSKPNDSKIQKFEEQRDREIQSWLKLAAFVLRKRNIKLGGES